MNNFGKIAGGILIFTDIAYSIYENYSSSSTTWFSSTVFDLSKIGVQTLISLAFSALIPGLGWAFGLAANVILDCLFETTGVNSYIEGKFNEFEKEKN